MQSAGQTSLHCGSSSAPTHSVHRSGSITYIGSPTLIASFGHTGLQASQAVQLSLMSSAMECLLRRGQAAARSSQLAQFAVTERAPQGRADRAGVD